MTVQIPSDTPQDLTGVIQSQLRMGEVLTSLQLEIGDSTVSLATINEAVKTQGWRLEEQGKRLEELSTLIKGANGDNSIMMRMAFAEKGLLSVAEEVKAHRTAVEEKLASIVASDLDRQKEARTRNWQFVFTLLTICGSILVAYLKH